MVGFGIFIMKSLFLSHNETLIIPEAGLRFDLPEKTFKMIESSGEPIRISLGQVSRKQATIEILLGESNLKKEQIKVGEQLQFAYDDIIYTLSLESIKAKVIGEETAHFLLTKKGSATKEVIEKSVSEIIGKIEQSEFEVFKKEKTFKKEKFLRQLKRYARKKVTANELMGKIDEDFSSFTIKENGKTYSIKEWIASKK